MTCVAELPRVDTLTEDYGAQGFIALGINCNEDLNSIVKPFARQHTYPFLRDTGVVFSRYRQITPAPPLNYIVDPAGVVRYWEEGFTEDSIRACIELWLPRPSDAGVTRIVAPADTVPGGLTLTPACSVANFGTSPASFSVRMKIGIAYDQTASVTLLAPGASAGVTFPGWVAEPSGAIAVTCSTELAGDERTGNDRQSAVVLVSAAVQSGWLRLPDVPAGPKLKAVKDGGALTGALLGGRDVVYAFKGNGTLEFYRFEVAGNAWSALESLPAIGASGKKKKVKKGSALTALNDRVYATKGASTLEFWQYNPAGLEGKDLGAYAWTQLADVPLGGKTLKEGTALTTDGSNVYLLKGSGTQEFYRYDIAGNTWTPLAPAPLGISNKPYKNGSALAFDSEHRAIRALKGSLNEMFSYDIDSGTWKQEATLPFQGRSEKKKKAKDGAGLACFDGHAYALKGGGTTELWRHSLDPTSWAQLSDMPMDMNKLVKNGGGLTAGSDRLYALKGNRTFQFFQYGPEAIADFAGAQGASLRTTGCGLRVAPNPGRGTMMIDYTLPRAGRAAVRLYDVSGKLVSTLTRGYYPAGVQSHRVRPGKISRGIYILRLELETATATVKLIVE